MRKRSIVLLSVLMLSLFFVTPTVAQTSQNLEWSTHGGDVFLFQYKYLDWVDDMVIINVSSTPNAIPDPLGDYDDIPGIPEDSTLTYLNGSPMGMEGFGFALLIGFKFIIPTGNWSLMSNLLENETQLSNPFGGDPVDIYNVTALENWYQWGYQYNVPGESEDIAFVYVSYLKADGFLSKINAVEYNSTSGEPILLTWIFRDGTPPIVDNPEDIVYPEGDTGNEIVWNATDMSPGAYMILKDSVELEKGLWNSSSEEIVVPVDGLSVGTYNYTITFFEASGLGTSDSVEVEVLDVVDPTIDSPSDISYEVGETSNTITWNPSDDYPVSYQILMDGSEIKSGPWNSSLETISVSVDGHSEGMYNYTAIVTDMGDNTANDTVWVNVTSPEVTTTTTTTTTSTTTTQTTTSITSTVTSTTITTSPTTSAGTTTTTSTTSNTTPAQPLPFDTMIIVIIAGGGLVVIIVIVIMRKR